MTRQIYSGYCHSCRRQRRLSAEKPNHILHFLITVFTCVWAPVWMMIAAKPARRRCDVCGSSQVDNWG